MRGRGYTVNSGGTLGGAGSIVLTNANVVVEDGGTLAPGSAAEPGTLTLGLSPDYSLTFSATSTLALELGTQSDMLAFMTSGDFLGGSGNAVLAITQGDGFDFGESYVIIDNVTTTGFTFDSITGVPPETEPEVTQVGDTYVLSFTPPPPEGSLFMLR